MCWLKKDVVPPVESSCCVSGVRGAGVMEPGIGATEYSIDRTGGDYRSFETPPDPKGKACADACQAEKNTSSRSKPAPRRCNHRKDQS